MVLFKGRIFRLALAISIGWHLLWVCVVRVELTSDKSKQKRYPVISFLGPILEDTIFRQEPKINLPRSVNTLPEKALVADNLDLRSWLLGKAVVNNIIQIRDSGKNFPGRPAGILDKRLPHFPEQSEFRQGRSDAVEFFSEIGQLRGPIKERTVLYRPSLPVLPDWTRREKLRLNIEVRFWVSPQGLVECAEPLISCGYPDIDLLMVSYLNKWRFQPLPADLDEEGRWGVMRFSLYDKN